MQLSALNCTEVRPLQWSNAWLPIEVTECGMVTEERLLQPSKAYSPIEVTEYVVPEYVTLDGIIKSPDE